MKTHNIMAVFGTRPEAIKMAPVVKALEQNKHFNTIVTITAQHREMLDQVLHTFNIHPDYDLNIMEKGQTLTHITNKVLEGLHDILIGESTEMVLVHGDTSTTFAASLAAFYQKIPVGHVEAGLRTFDKYAPFPEEMNRRLTGCLADLHFAPTLSAKEHLFNEGVAKDKIFITGNTIIDALKQTLCNAYVFNNEILKNIDMVNGKCILLTCHRRENIGQPMENIFLAVREIATANSDISIIFPVHLNQKIRETAQKYLAGQKNIYLTAPLDYQDIVNLMNKSYLILTDSGGIQEEAAALGKPVFVLRDITERTEALECGVARIIGTNTGPIINAVNTILYDPGQYEQMAGSPNPFGDGTASKRISHILSKYFGYQDA